MINQRIIPCIFQESNCFIPSLSPLKRARKNVTPRCYLEQFLPLASRAEVGNPILDAEKPNSVIKKPLNKIFQGSSKAFSEWVQVD